MKTEWQRQMDRDRRDKAFLKWAVALFFAAIFLTVVFFAVGCAGPVVPGKVESRTVAFEGEEQNAGVLMVFAKRGALLTERKKAEYDALVALYGRGTVGHPLVPAVEPGRGLKRGTGLDYGFLTQPVVWEIDAEHLTYFLLFKEWARQSRSPL